MRNVRLKLDDRYLPHLRQEVCRLAGEAGRCSDPLWVMAGHVLSEVDDRLYSRCKQLPLGKPLTLRLHPYEAIAIWRSYEAFPPASFDHAVAALMWELHRHTL